MKKFIRSGWLGGFLVCSTFLTLNAQFAPPAGQPGSTAIAADSSVFVGWATDVSIERGLRDVAQPDSGLVSFGVPVDALGAPDNVVVSLGDGGTATLTFAQPITDGPGPDFAVFENSFSDTFLELAFVEVSSNGVDFVRFPAISLTQTETPVGGFGAVDATQLHNLAGKYRGGFGVPFDLNELPPSNGFDPTAVTHVRLIDCIGTLDPDLGTMDSEGNPINEIYPSNFPSGGFDLDAVGVIHLVTSTEEPAVAEELRIFPNPVRSGGMVRVENAGDQVTARLTSVEGKIWELKIEKGALQLPQVPAGAYGLLLKKGAPIRPENQKPPQTLLVIF